MVDLVMGPNLAHVDDIYQRLIEVHAELSGAESLRLNARLILILINHIGNEQVVFEAIEAASRNPTQGET